MQLFAQAIRLVGMARKRFFRAKVELVAAAILTESQLEICPHALALRARASPNKR